MNPYIQLDQDTTHTMDNLTGLLTHFGAIQPPELVNKLRVSLGRDGC